MNVGTPIAGITTDYDVETRPLTTPAIGADEFSAPVIAIEQPVLTGIADGGSRNFGGVGINSNTSLTFTLKNTGTGNLYDPTNGSNSFSITLDGANASDFSVTAAPTAPVFGGASTTFTVSFAPNVAGAKAAALHLSSVDPTQNPYDITLTGQGLSFTTDTDGDGLNDGTEFQLASLGFDPAVTLTALVNTLFNNIGGAPTNLNAVGFFTTAQVQALNVGAPLIQKNAGTGDFTLTMGVEKSTNLSTFFPFSMSALQTTINGAGKLEFLTVPDNAAFFRIESR